MILLNIRIIERNDYNDDDAVKNIVSYVFEQLQLSEEQRKSLRDKCWQVAKLAHWNNFICNYFDLYDSAIRESEKRLDLYYFKTIKDYVVTSPKEIEIAEWRKVYVKPEYPAAFTSSRYDTKSLVTWDEEAIELLKNINPVY